MYFHGGPFEGPPFLLFLLYLSEVGIFNRVLCNFLYCIVL